jgi:hypothetical protein
VTTVEDSGTWLIEQATDEAKLHGEPLSESEVALLSKSIFELDDDDRPVMFALTNRLVPLLRSRIERSKAMGRPSVRVRRGLVLPIEWNDHYLRVYDNELSWPISAIMQNVLLGNPLTGERKPWKSK